MVVFSWQFIDKPGSVVDDHLSSLVVAYHIKRISTCKRVTFNADLLAANRVYLRTMSPWHAVGFYPTRFTFSQHLFKALRNIFTKTVSP